MLLGGSALGRLVLACCCLPRLPDAGLADGPVPPAAPGVGAGQELDRAALARGRRLTPLELAELTQIARRISKETGRTCGDFFPLLLRPGPSQDLALAGRATLLTQVNNLNDGQRLFASTTICANIDEEERRSTARVPPPRVDVPRVIAPRFAVFDNEPATIVSQRVNTVDFPTAALAFASIPSGAQRVPFGTREPQQPGIFFIKRIR